MSSFSRSKARRKARSSNTQNRAHEYFKRYQLDASFSEDKKRVTHKKKGPTGISNGEWLQEKNKIGEGAQSTIWKQVKQSNSMGTKQIRAVKRIEVNIWGSEVDCVRARRELNLLMSVQHRHQDLFVRCHGWYHDEAKNHLYIAMDFHLYSDLRAYLKEYGPQGEDDSRKFTKQLLRGLVVLHSNKICHRDIRPENILIVSVLPLHVKITDFGISSPADTEQTPQGEANYAAPEQLQGRSKCTTAVDMWSLGCVLYELLTSQAPFNAYARIDFRSVEWKAKTLGVSDIARDFLKRLVIIDPSSRISSTMAFQHPWIYALDTEERALWYGDRRSILNPHWGELST